MWPVGAESLVAVQHELARRTPEPWRLPERSLRVAGCWVCFPRGLTGRGATDDPAWAAAVTLRDGRVKETALVEGRSGGPYEPGLLALRIGELLDRTVRLLDPAPDVVMLDASSRDHPRGAGLALHLGAATDLPTVGVTHRPLMGQGNWPADERGATAPIRVGDEVVGCWLRTRAGARPLVVHPGWRIELSTAAHVVLMSTPRHRTPEPLRLARRIAREARGEPTSANRGSSRSG